MIKDNNNCCKKCFSNPCVCTPCSYDNCDCYDDLPDIQTSLESILDSEASISECASRLFNALFPCEYDSGEDTQKKINLFNALLMSYSNRSSSLGKLLTAISYLDETYVPNPHIDIFDDCTSDSKTSLRTSKINHTKLPKAECQTHPKEVSSGLYFLEKIKIHFSKYNVSKTFEIYFNSKTLKIIYTPAKNSCNITKTYII